MGNVDPAEARRLAREAAEAAADIRKHGGSSKAAATLEALARFNEERAKAMADD